MNDKGLWWPRAIFGFIGLFFLAMVGFVVYTTRHRTELVAPDYYNQEIRYQERIDATRRAIGLGRTNVVAHDAAAAAILVSLADSSGATGIVAAYRPASAALDRSWTLDLDAGGRQAIPTAGLPAGPWRISVAWYLAGQSYYTESLVVLP